VIVTAVWVLMIIVKDLVGILVMNARRVPPQAHLHAVMPLQLMRLRHPQMRSHWEMTLRLAIEVDLQEVTETVMEIEIPEERIMVVVTLDHDPVPESTPMVVRGCDSSPLSSWLSFPPCLPVAFKLLVPLLKMSLGRIMAQW
jgi:hypothetical protein